MKVNCYYNGSFYVAEMYSDRFNCPSDSFEEPEYEEPLKDNVMIVLRGSGRDFQVHDEDIKSEEDLDKLITGNSEWLEFGGLTFRTEEIAMYSYIGD